MKDKKRDEMPDILSDILGNKPEPKKESKPDIKPLEHHDIITPQHQDTTVNELINVKQDEEKKPIDITTSQHHDVIAPVAQDKQTTKPKIYRTTLYLPEDLYNKLDEVWLKERKNGLSKNAIIETALRKYII
jgi:hypothetical protein